MRLTPEEIEARRFRLAPNGYECEAVDRFLAEITEALRDQPKAGLETDEFVAGPGSPSYCDAARAALARSGPRPTAAASVRSRAELEAADIRRKPSSTWSRRSWRWPTPRPRPRSVLARPTAEAEAGTKARPGRGRRSGRGPRDPGRGRRRAPPHRAGDARPAARHPRRSPRRHRAAHRDVRAPVLDLTDGGMELGRGGRRGRPGPGAPRADEPRVAPRTPASPTSDVDVDPVDVRRIGPPSGEPSSPRPPGRTQAFATEQPSGPRKSRRRPQRPLTGTARATRHDAPSVTDG